MVDGVKLLFEQQSANPVRGTAGLKAKRTAKRTAMSDICL
jgi:hypothetical protein